MDKKNEEPKIKIIDFHDVNFFDCCDCEEINFQEKIVVDVYPETSIPGNIKIISFDFDKNDMIISSEREEAGTTKVCKIKCGKCGSLFLSRISFPDNEENKSE